MSRDTILTEGTGVRYSYDNLKTQGWLDGHSSGLMAAAEFPADIVVQIDEVLRVVGGSERRDS